MDVCYDVIKPLPQDVIAKIAAGEVVIRPCAVLKELIENSIDAGATYIKFSLSPNPLEFGEIEDNGCGISPNDMLIVCKRFTTSKTRDTLNGIKSFGFRGEALAALSQTAYVSISSRTKYQEKRMLVRYVEGEPLLDEIEEMDGPQGFTLSYSKLFYTMGTRHKALGLSSGVEFNLCIELMQKYALHFPDITFVFHKIGNTVHEFTTYTDDKKTTKELSDYDFEYFNTQHEFPPSVVNNKHLEYQVNVVERTTLHMNKVKRTLRDICGGSLANSLNTFMAHELNVKCFNCRGFYSHPDHPAKYHDFIIFINNRLVTQQEFKKMIDSVYREFVPKKQRRFVYFSIFMPYERIDANVHPSKQTLMMEYQNEIIQEIVDRFRVIV